VTERILFLVGLALPRIAPACSVCFAARDQTDSTYAFTTALLSAVPLVMFGGFFWWLRRRSRALELEAERTPLSRQP